jgi:hypothetical protein
MGGKSRKTGGISRVLIERLKSGRITPSKPKAGKPKTDEPKEFDLK